VSEKTEPASEKKLEDARKKGQVAHSADLSSAFSFAFALGGLMATASTAQENVRHILSIALSTAPQTGDRIDRMMLATYGMAVDALWIVVPVLGFAVLGALVGGLSHVGFHVSFEPVMPQFEKLDPVAGAKKLFSVKSLIEVLKAIIKAVFIGWILWLLVRSVLPMLVFSGYGQADSIGASAWSAILKLFTVCATLFVVLGVVDFVIQRLIFLKQQKMTKDEVRREYKQMEGDPQIKGQRKAIAHEIAFSNPAAAAASANAVVVNPTHYAVALRYVPEECGLPVVVAKGVDAQAAVIREAARQAGVPIIGNPELARALYKVETNQTVPEPFLESVAIVLRWAEQLRGGQPA